MKPTKSAEYMALRDISQYLNDKYGNIGVTEDGDEWRVTWGYDKYKKEYPKVKEHLYKEKYKEMFDYLEKLLNIQ